MSYTEHFGKDKFNLGVDGYFSDGGLDFEIEYKADGEGFFSTDVARTELDLEAVIKLRDSLTEKINDEINRR